MAIGPDNLKEIAAKSVEQTSSFGIADSVIAGALVGAIVASILTYVLQKRFQAQQSKKLLFGHWSALRAEIIKCGQMANHHATHGIKAPSYRLPVIVYETSMPHILANADLGEEDVDQLQEFYVKVNSLNRGLDICESYTLPNDIVNDIKMREHEANLDEFHLRNLLKSATIIDKQQLTTKELKKIEQFIYQPANRWRTEVGSVFEKASLSCDRHIAKFKKKRSPRRSRLPFRVRRNAHL